MKNYLPFIFLCVATFALKAQNHPPTIISKSSISGCFGQQVCVDITTNDADGDSTFIMWDKTLSQAVFTNNNSQVLFATGSVCVTFDRGNHAAGQLLPFIIFVTDKNDTTSKVISAIVHDYPEGAHPSINQSTPGVFEFDIKGDTTLPWSAYPGLTFSTYIKNNNDSIVFAEAKRNFTYTAPSSGRYIVYTNYKTSVPCVYTAIDTLFYFPVSVNEINNYTVTIYPNPVADELIISGLPGSTSEIIITDMTGKKVAGYKESVKQDNKWDVSSLPPGVYVISVKDAGSTTVARRRFIKQ